MKIKKQSLKEKAVQKNIRTTWNLKLLYKSAIDPQIEKDMQMMEKASADFAKKWREKDFSKPELLFKSLQDYEQLEEIISTCRVYAYYALSREIDTGNQKLTGLITKTQERIVQAINQTLFYSLAIGTITKPIQNKILKDVKFKKYQYLLSRIFINAQYQLSEPEEKIMALKVNPAYSLWIDMTEKAIGELTVVWKGEIMPITKASGMIQVLPKQSDRKKLHDLILEKLSSISLIAEAEMNAVINNKKIDDSLRGFSQPFESTLIDYHNTPTELSALISAVKKYESLTGRLFTLKKKLMKVEKLGAYDMALQLSTTHKKYSFDDAVTIVRNAFEKVSPEYRNIFDSFLRNGQIDVYPRGGKKGGGYCWGDYNQPTYILLNWNETFNSVRTLAHEMGHAIHAEYSNRNQGVLYHDHPVSTAEVASTLFENFVREELFSTLSPREQLFERYNHIQESCMAIHRQINHFLFEQEMYAGVYEKGSLSTDEISGIRLRYLKKYMGPSAQLEQHDGLSWITHSHMRLFFYVYSYAYGQLISTAMYAKYKQDNTFVDKINQFLSAGGSDTPENIFKSIGIDTAKPEFWEIGLKSIEQDIKDLEKECKKLKLI